MKQFFTSVFSVIPLLVALTSFAQGGEVRTSGQVDLINNLSVEIALDEDNVTMHLTGPADRWFAIGFNAIGMAPGTDVFFYADGSEGTTGYDGRLTGQNAPVEDDTQNWTVTDVTTESGLRTVTASRPLDTGDGDDYAFDFNTSSLTVIYSHGSSESTELAFHGSNRGSSVLEFMSTVSTSSTPSFEESIALFPNPTVSEINIALSESAVIETIRIYDADARIIRTLRMGAGADRLNIPVADLAAGVYFAEFSSDRDRAVKRFVIE